MRSILIIVGSTIAGIALGVLSGFAKNVYQATKNGSYVQPANPILVFLTRPTSQMSTAQTITAFLFVMASLPITFALLLAPAVLGGIMGQLNNDTVIAWAFAFEISSILVFRSVGAWLWWRVS
ncbi:MAG TPA: hypothetical protein VFK88_08355 [Gallionella sp.]|nr:hypothetical protein [Gallionella sp.]